MRLYEEKEQVRKKDAIESVRDIEVFHRSLFEASVVWQLGYMVYVCTLNLSFSGARIAVNTHMALCV